MRLFVKPIPLISIAVVIIIVGGFLFFGQDRTPSFDFIVAERGDLIQEVSVTGRVKPAQSVDLAFEKAGKVAWVNAAVGDTVFAGQILVQLENGDFVAAREQAEARVAIEKAKLNELLGGVRLEEIKVQRVKVGNAKSAHAKAEKELVDTLLDAYTKSDDAVRNRVDQFFNNPRSKDPQLNLLVSDPQLELDIESGRFSIESLLTSWQVSLVGLSAESNLETETSSAQGNLADVKLFLDNTALAVNNLNASSNFSQATIDGYKADVSVARTNVNAAISNLSAAFKKTDDAESAVALAEQELALKEAGTRNEQIAAQEARVKEMEANVRVKEAELSKTLLLAPIGGVVAVQNAKVGEIVSANAAIISLISASRFEIEAFVPEADVAKLTLGDMARVTLDAYGSDALFSARVADIDPAETIREGVATYKTTLQFTKRNERIKSGMTANIDVVTGERGGVIAVPGRAVLTRDGERFVRIADDTGVIRESVVETGLRGSRGDVEILSGVEEGDKVIIFLEEEQ